MAEEMVRIEPVLSAVPPQNNVDNRPDPTLRIGQPQTYFDITTLLALILSALLISGAIAMGRSGANFLDIPSVLIVILGTITITSMSYTGRELRLAAPIIWGSVSRQVYDPPRIARELLDIAVMVRRRGILYLSSQSNELKKNPFMHETLQMVTDGLSAPEIDRYLHQYIDVTLDRYRRAAGLLRRASEIAPAMGLIGTLIGLVQMLVSLDDPSSIGPAMALALLTTFYGAIMGSVVLAPLAAKLDRNANEDVMVKSLIQAAAIAIVTQENPRKLELELNSLLPADQRIQYFNY